MIVVGTTLTTYSVLDPQRSFLWEAWLYQAEALRSSHPGGVDFFVAIQTDGRGREPFAPLLERLAELGGTAWWFSLDDGRIAVTGENRGRHLTMGQNLASEYATSVGASHLLHMAADCEAPPDAIPKLLALNNGIAAAACSTYFGEYGRGSHAVAGFYEFPVVGPPMTAVCVLIARELFKRIKWRWDPDLGMTDDPSFTHDALELFTVRTLTRLDCVASHHPAAIGPIDERYPGLDLSTPR